MKLCPQCNKNQIEDKYSMCMSCLKETKQANQNVDLKDIQEKINWNLGSISQTMKLSLLSEFETLQGNGIGRTDTQKKMHSALLKDLDKYLKVMKDIKKEQEK